MKFREVHLNPTQRRLARAANVEDLRKIARKRLPKGVFDYIDGAADTEWTMRENSSGFKRIAFRPRILRDVSNIETKTTLLGKTIDFPLVLAPTGFGRIAHSQGELAVARSADRANLPYTLSTLGTRSIEEVSAVSKGRKWFQVYVWKDRELLKEMLQRASVHGFEAIMITVDTPILGRRERDIRNGFTLPPKIGIDTLLSGMIRPGWVWDFLRAEPITFANVGGSHQGGDKSPIYLSEYINGQFDPSLSWSDVEWFQKHWKGPIILKGIQTVADAQLAAKAGVDAIALSNHGGRQLDYSPAMVDLVAPVADAVGDQVEIICDGGIRHGSDIVKAVALGARACMLGRPYLYALGAGGEAGVDFLLETLRRGFGDTLALTGTKKTSDLNRDIVHLRDHR
ncbi:MAG: alpha-hydroxy-acid oxidizing enzyme [Deltaproteobacteria bacterium]|nr:alpha-hydroxy-acid oxidizing enzyme [Deltaproteobacteria bacterium]